MVVAHVSNIYLNNNNIILWYPFQKVIIVGQLQDDVPIQDGDIYTSKLVRGQELIDLNLHLVGLTVLHGQLVALNGNGHLDLVLSSGVGGNTGEKHGMVQRYGCQENFHRAKLCKGHHEKQRCLRR